jgi:lysophospholipase L1-like esterase
MRKIFIIGDSISIQYGPFLEKMTAGSFDYARKEGTEEALENLDIPVGANGGDSSMVLAYLKYKLQEPDFSPDTILLNCGLHDIKVENDDGRHQVEIDAYRKNLQAILKLIKEKGIDFIWIRSTPVVEHIHNSRVGFKRYSEDIQAYNRVADEIFADCPIIDLYYFTLKYGEEAFCDHVHYKENIREIQAAYICGFLNALYLK